MNAVAALLPQNHRPFPDLTADLCTDLPIRLSGPYRHRFVRQTLQRLDPANHPLPPDDPRLHDIRRAIKDLLYAWPYLSNSARRLAASPLGGRSQLRSAAQLLGDYLDAASLTHIQLPAAGIVGHSAIGHWKRSCQEKKFGLRKTIDYTLGARLHFNPHPAPAATPVAFNPLTAGNPSQQSVELHVD